MNTGRALLYAIMHTGRSAGGAHRGGSLRTARTQAIHGLVGPAIVLVSLGATAAAAPAHAVSGPASTAVNKAAITHAIPTIPHSARACKIARSFASSTGPKKMPWMYAITPYRMPWMYAMPYRMPWMYTPQNIARITISCARHHIHPVPESRSVSGRGFRA
jgi:hypothetical protein